MSGPRSAIRTRIAVGVVVTVVAVGALGIVSLLGGDPDGASSSTVTGSVPTTVDVVEEDQIPVTSVQIPEDWQPKGSSLYSDRKPTSDLDESVGDPSSSTGGPSSDESEAGR